MRVRDPASAGKALSVEWLHWAGKVSLRGYLHFQCNPRRFWNEKLWVMHTL